jgi:hypothetical protein
MRIATVVACMSITCSAYAAVPCHSSKDGDGYWSWREVDGRRCWYPGRPGKPKTELFWQSAAKSMLARSMPMPTPAPAREPQAPAASPVLFLHVAPATPATPADIFRARPMTDGALIETPGTVIPDAIPPQADQCCWPRLEELPFAERWSGLQR